MSCTPGRPTDFEVLLEQRGTFRCHICSDEPALLYRFRIQEWPTRGCNLQEFLDGERFTIRRRLVCARCLKVGLHGGLTITRLERSNQRQSE